MLDKHAQALPRSVGPVAPSRRLSSWMFGLGMGGIVMLFTPAPGYFDPRLLRAFWDFGHFCLFMVLAMAVTSWLAPRWKGSSWGMGAAIFAGLIVLGALTEILQGLTPDRQPSFQDLWMDGFGTLMGLAVSTHFIERIAMRWRTKIVLLALPGMALGLLPFFTTLSDDINSVRQFPVLGSLESGLEMSRWTGSAKLARTQEQVFQGDWALAVEFQPGRYSGVRLRDFPEDWTGFQTLHVDLWSEQTASVIIRVHDRQHESGRQRYEDRFTRRFHLMPGWNSINIPLADIALAPGDRIQDLQWMREVGLYTARLEAPLKIYLDNLRLQP